MSDSTNAEELRARIKSLEADLVQERARTDQLTKNSKDMIWITDKDHNFSYVSPVVETMLGFSQELVVGQHLLTNDRSEDRAEISALLKKIDELAGNGDIEGLKRIEVPEREAQLINSTRKVIYTEVRMSLLLAEDGTFLGLMGVNRDVSERNKIQALLKWNERLFRAVLRPVRNRFAFSMFRLASTSTSITASVRRRAGVGRKRLGGALTNWHFG